MVWDRVSKRFWKLWEQCGEWDSGDQGEVCKEGPEGRVVFALAGRAEGVIRGLS